MASVVPEQRRVSLMKTFASSHRYSMPNSFFSTASVDKTTEKLPRSRQGGFGASSSSSFEMSAEAVEEIVRMALGQDGDLKSEIAARRRRTLFASRRMFATQISFPSGQRTTNRVYGSAVASSSEDFDNRERLFNRSRSYMPGSHNTPAVTTVDGITSFRQSRRLSAPCLSRDSVAVGNVNRSSVQPDSDSEHKDTNASNVDTDAQPSGPNSATVSPHSVTLSESPVLVHKQLHSKIPSPPPLPPSLVTTNGVRGSQVQMDTEKKAEEMHDVEKDLREANMVIKDLERENESLWFQVDKLTDDLEILGQTHNEVLVELQLKKHELFEIVQEAGRLKRELREKNEVLSKLQSVEQTVFESFKEPQVRNDCLNHLLDERSEQSSDEARSALVLCEERCQQHGHQIRRGVRQKVFITEL